MNEIDEFARGLIRHLLKVVIVCDSSKKYHMKEYNSCILLFVENVTVRGS